MKLFNRHEQCIGVVLWKWRQTFVQLWYCPKGYEIKTHSHPEEDIELMYIFGKTVFYKDSYSSTRAFKPKWYHMFQTFSVPAGTAHWFTVSNIPLLFINFSTFKQGFKAKSAAIDFKPTN